MAKIKASAALPSKLFIGSYEFPLRVVPADDDALKDDNGAASDGMTVTDGTENEMGIWIASGLGLRRRFEIVWHETTHAVNWVYDVGPKEGDEDDSIAEEEIATAHGKAWTQLLLDNPAFERWIVYTTNRIRREQRTGTHEPVKTNETSEVTDADAKDRPSAVATGT